MLAATAQLLSRQFQQITTCTCIQDHSLSHSHQVRIAKRSSGSHDRLYHISAAEGKFQHSPRHTTLTCPTQLVERQRLSTLMPCQCLSIACSTLAKDPRVLDWKAVAAAAAGLTYLFVTPGEFLPCLLFLSGWHVLTTRLYRYGVVKESVWLHLSHLIRHMLASCSGIRTSCVGAFPTPTPRPLRKTWSTFVRGRYP